MVARIGFPLPSAIHGNWRRDDASEKPGSDLGGESPPVSAAIENQVHANLARLAAEFGSVATDLSITAQETLISTINDIVHPETPAEACLAPALALFGWAGEGRLIREALPHFDRIDNIEALRRVLCLLGYGTTRKFSGLSGIKPHSMPCLFTRDGTDVTLIVEREPDGTLLVFDGKSAAWKKIEPRASSAGYFLFGTSQSTPKVSNKVRPGYLPQLNNSSLQSWRRLDLVC